MAACLFSPSLWQMPNDLNAHSRDTLYYTAKSTETRHTHPHTLCVTHDRILLYKAMVKCNKFTQEKRQNRLNNRYNQSQVKRMNLWASKKIRPTDNDVRNLIIFILRNTFFVAFSPFALDMRLGLCFWCRIKRIALVIQAFRFTMITLVFFFEEKN